MLLAGLGLALLIVAGYLGLIAAWVCREDIWQFVRALIKSNR